MSSDRSSSAPSTSPSPPSDPSLAKPRLPGVSASVPGDGAITVARVDVPEEEVKRAKAEQEAEEKGAKVVGRTDSGRKLVEDVGAEKVAGEEGYVRIEE